MSITVFISCVTDELQSYRVVCEQRLGQLSQHAPLGKGIAPFTQETRRDYSGSTTLEMLDGWIASCTHVVQLVGRRSCGTPTPPSAIATQFDDLITRHPDIVTLFHGGRDEAMTIASYTHWEAWLAIYHGKPLKLFRLADAAPVDTTVFPEEQQHKVLAHLQRLENKGRYPDAHLISDQNDFLLEVFSFLVGGPASIDRRRFEKIRELHGRAISTLWKTKGTA
jgi:hypothetical protein